MLFRSVIAELSRFLVDGEVDVECTAGPIWSERCGLGDLVRQHEVDAFGKVRGRGEGARRELLELREDGAVNSGVSDVDSDDLVSRFVACADPDRVVDLRGRGAVDGKDIVRVDDAELVEGIGRIHVVIHEAMNRLRQLDAMRCHESVQIVAFLHESAIL